MQRYCKQYLVSNINLQVLTERQQRLLQQRDHPQVSSSETLPYKVYITYSHMYGILTNILLTHSRLELLLPSVSSLGCRSTEVIAQDVGGVAKQYFHKGCTGAAPICNGGTFCGGCYSADHCEGSISGVSCPTCPGNAPAGLSCMSARCLKF